MRGKLGKLFFCGLSDAALSFGELVVRPRAKPAPNPAAAAANATYNIFTSQSYLYYFFIKHRDSKARCPEKLYNRGLSAIFRATGLLTLMST